MNDNIKSIHMHGFDAAYKINNESLNWLEPVIIQFLKLHRDYLEGYSFEDSLYWYNERANISALAGAVWRCSGFALEEYSAEKGSGKEISNGRIDMYFSLADNESVIEAKQHWLNIHSSKNADYNKAIVDTHNDAKKEITRTMGQKTTEQGLAVTFIIPHWKTDKDAEIGESIKMVRNVILGFDSDISIWLHNETGKSLKNDDGRIFDSFAVIMNLA